MEEKNTSELKQIINDIEKENILLPSFQREFTWRDEDMQKGLVCSVLARMPVGSILLLKSTDREFGCKKIGLKTPISKADDKSVVQYLLDGQQRLTVLSNVFSNVIFEGLTNYNFLINDSLKRRFFIKLPSWKSIFSKESSNDIFGIKYLKFPINNPDIEFPTFLTGEIEPYVICKTFLANDDKFYNPKKEINNDLKKACLNEKSSYLIPLYLLAPTDSKLSASTTYMRKIIEGIGNEIVSEIKDYYDKLSDDDKISFIAHIVDRPKDDIDSQLEEKATYWSDKMIAYLNVCASKICLHQIILDGEDRGRAIDIYENLNKGGISLSTFDLIVAKVAKADPINNFYERIRNNIITDANKKYDFNLLSDDIKSYAVNANYKNASKSIQTCKNNSNSDISPNFTDPFLNIMGILRYSKSNTFSDVKIDFTKRNVLLKIEADFINSNCEKICTALDRAYFFFQTRCGIRKIGEINYQWMITIISLIFIKDENFFNKDIHNLLEAWYWACIFSGEFNSDQNDKAIKNLKLLYQHINKEIDNKWIEIMIDKVFDCENFSKKDFILMEYAKLESYPKKPFRNFICQFYLSRTYPDLISNTVLSVFYDEADSLEAHHLLPVGAYKNYEQNSEEVRSNEKHLCNSPVNFVYITPRTNKDIGKEDLHSYVTRITTEARAKLNISGFFSNSNCQQLIDDDNSLDKRLDIAKQILDERFDFIKGTVVNRIKSLLGI